METGNSSRTTARAPKKSDTRCHTWTHREEETLIIALKEIIAAGWKCENGFRTGYLQVLQKHMVNTFPGIDIQADPHINSKIHVWKKHHGSLFSMLSCSGFGWNDKSNMIEVDSDDVWDNYVKTDAHAKGLRYKTFPFYKDWCEIFGKDRATGENAVDFNSFENEPLDVDGFRWEDWTSGLGTEDENDFMLVCQPSPTAILGSAKKQKSSKKKSVDQQDNRIGKEIGKELIGIMGNFYSETSSKLRDIAKRIGYEFDASEKRSAVYEALGQLGELTKEQQIYVGKQLVNNISDLDYFFSLPDDDKLVMVKMMLAEQI